MNDRWLRDSQAQWKRQPEDRYLLKPGHRKTPSLASIPDTQANGRPVDGNGTEAKSSAGAPSTITSEDKSDTLNKVSSVEEYTGNGTNPRASANEIASASRGEGDQHSSTDPVIEEGNIELHIDWAEIDKEVEDALASDDDDYNSEDS